MKPIFIVLVLSIALLLSVGTFASDMDSAGRTIGEKLHRYEYGPVKGTSVQTYVVTRRPFVDSTTMTVPKLPKPVPITPHETQTWVVHFDFGSSEISESEEKKLYRLSNIIDRDQVVDVAGYTCQTGGFEVNDRLAWQRAKNVADLLKSHGVNVGEVIGKPMCCYVSELEPAINRRVEIVLDRKSN